LLPDFATVQNPLDTTGFGHARARPRPTKAEDDLMEIAVYDSGVDFVYNMMTPLPGEQPADPTFIESRMHIIGEMVAQSPVPVFLSSNTCLDVSAYAQGLLDDNGLYLLPGVNLAMSSIGDLVRWNTGRGRILARPRPSVPAMRWERPDLTGTWAEDDGRDLLSAAGVPLVPARLASSAGDAARFAADFGGPVAMKICSADIAHKSDAGGVALGVPPERAAETYTGLIAAVAASRPGAVIRGVLVSPIRTGGQELLVGVTVDPTFGPVLAVGLGGVWVEALADLSLRVLPVDVTTVRDMLSELRGYNLLCGARGSLAADLDVLAGTIVAISHAALALGGALESLEVNPLRVRGAEVEALDVLVTTAGAS
jgi:acetate---CoA ligase (ADP-forming)